MIAEIIYPQLGLWGLFLLVLIGAFWKLNSELMKLRVEVSYDLSRDLLSKRFAAYGELWSRMRTVAIYTKSPFGPIEATALFEDLSTWYFSENGGLLLTSRARDFYFPLQELLRTFGRLTGWRCDPRPTDPEIIFADLLAEISRKDPKLKPHVDLVRRPDKLEAKDWKAVCESVSERLESLVDESDPKAGEAIYAAIQQVSSVLRSNLADELRSRLDVQWPTPR